MQSAKTSVLEQVEGQHWGLQGDPKMYYLPFMITSPKTEAHAMQAAGGTRQTKTSWILIFLNYTWSMCCHFLSNFVSWSFEETLYSYCCYNFLHRDLWKQIDEDKKSSYAYFDSLWFNMYYRGNNVPNVLKWIKAKRIFSRQYVFIPIVCWWVIFTITLLNHLMNCWIGYRFPLILLLQWTLEPPCLMPLWWGKLLRY